MSWRSSSRLTNYNLRKETEIRKLIFYGGWHLHAPLLTETRLAPHIIPEFKLSESWQLGQEEEIKRANMCNTGSDTRRAINYHFSSTVNGLCKHFLSAAAPTRDLENILTRLHWNTSKGQCSLKPTTTGDAYQLFFFSSKITKRFSETGTILYIWY